jgi:hypothetical protein
MVGQGYHSGRGRKAKIEASWRFRRANMTKVNIFEKSRKNTGQKLSDNGKWVLEAAARGRRRWLFQRF